MTPIPPITDTTIPIKFMRVLTTVAVAGAVASAGAEGGDPPAAALGTVDTDADDIL
jgi:hypothetical protein